MGPKVYGYPYILHDLVVGQIFHFFINLFFFSSSFVKTDQKVKCTKGLVNVVLISWLVSVARLVLRVNVNYTQLPHVTIQKFNLLFMCILYYLLYYVYLT